jgi:hypothetical protein
MCRFYSSGSSELKMPNTTRVTLCAGYRSWSNLCAQS